MTELIHATINGLPVEVEKGVSILDAARQVHVRIPTLCKHPDLDATAACGICIVQIKNNGKMLRACCTPIEEKMDILTETPEIVDVRRSVLELTLSRHPNECLTCLRNHNCELQTLAADFGLTATGLDNIVPDLASDGSTHSIVLDPRKCISCGRCIQVCQQDQNVWALSFLNRGFDTRIAAAGDIPLADSPCVRCGQCSAHCPTGAIVEYDESVSVWEKLQTPMPSASRRLRLLFAWPLARPSASPSAPTSPARSTHRCAAWASRPSSTPTLALTSPSWKRPLSSKRACSKARASCR